MDVDPTLRSIAAHSFIDALRAADPDAAGEEATDNAMLLALEPLGMDTADPQQVANYAAATELLYFFVAREAHTSGQSVEVVIHNLRALLPQMGY